MDGTLGIPVGILRVVVLAAPLSDARRWRDCAERLPNVEVVAFADAAPALDWCAGAGPALILLDDALPEPGAIDFLERLRRRLLPRELPVLLLTATADRQWRERALRVGASDFLGKPVDPAEFRARARNLLALQACRLELEALKGRLGLSTAAEPPGEPVDRAQFVQRLEAELLRARRSVSATSLLLLHLDAARGDGGAADPEIAAGVLRSLVQTLRRQTRQTDDVGRLDGDRFAILLPETERAGAFVLATRLLVRTRAGQSASPCPADRWTVSIGVHTVHATPDDAASMLRHAEAALARARDDGGDRVEAG